MFTIRNTAARPSTPHTPPTGLIALFFGFVALLLATIAAMITHIVVCIKTSAWFLLLFGILAPPIGVIHGVGVWLGVF
jgi:hypothetical protein